MAEVSERLKKAEAALQLSEHLLLASHYAGAIMHEAINPLEALANLVYLTQYAAEDAGSVRKNMEIAEGQLVLLSEITRKTLSFCRVQRGERLRPGGGSWNQR